MKYLAIYIKAPNDLNGNPQRGWIVFDTAQNTPGVWIDEDYTGDAPLNNHTNRDVAVTAPIYVTGNELKRQQAIYPKE